MRRVFAAPGPAEARLRVHVEQVAMLYAAALPQNLDNIRLKRRGQWRPSLPTGYFQNLDLDVKLDPQSPSGPYFEA